MNAAIAFPEAHPPVETCMTEEKQNVIRAVAQELTELSEKHVAMQGVIMPLLKSDALNNGHMVEIQSADIVAQHLVELSKFLGSYVRLTEAGEKNSVTAAINDIVLSALAERLATVCLGVQASGAASDPVEFF